MRCGPRTMDVLFGVVVHIVDAFTAAYLRRRPSAVAERVRTVPQRLCRALPLYSDPLWPNTPFRSAVASPLPGALQQTATLTLLFHSSYPPAIAEPDLAALGDRITNSLLDTSDQPPHLAQDDRPSWLD